MNDLFQLCSCRLVLGIGAEDQPADLAAVDFTRGGEDGIAKNIFKTFFDRGLFQNLVTGRVSFDDFDGMFFTKLPGEMAFSRSNATDQADYGNSSRSIRQAETGEPGGERPWTAWAWRT